MAKKEHIPRVDTERRARLEAVAREQAAVQRRRTAMIAGGSALVLLAIVVAVFLAVRGDGRPTAAAASTPPTSSTASSSTQATPATSGTSPGSGTTAPVSAQVAPSAVTGGTTTQPPAATVPNTTGIDGVVAYDTAGYPAAGTPGAGTLGHDHVSGPVAYSVVPPVGGPHSATWMNAGIYTVPVPSERAVHNLEHGAVWITYRPDLPAADVATLTDLVLAQSKVIGPDGSSNRFIDLSPWAGNALPSPVVISSWGYQLKVDSPSDPRLQKFIDTFRFSRTYSPEYGSPADGVPVAVGGRPARQ